MHPTRPFTDTQPITEDILFAVLVKAKRAGLAPELFDLINSAGSHWCLDASADGWEESDLFERLGAEIDDWTPKRDQG